MASAQRDRLLRDVRAARWAAGLGAAGLTAAFSVAAANAFKGHDGHARAQTSTGTRVAHARVSVPAPDKVPSIAADGSLQAPQQAPQAAAPAQTQQVPQQQQQAPQQRQQQQAPAQPPVSGGS